MPTPFPPNKSARELGIDTTRKFIVIDGKGNSFFKEGAILSLVFDDETPWPSFTDGNETHVVHWFRLAYAPEPSPEPYKPQVGDRIRLVVELEINHIEKDGWFKCTDTQDKRKWLLEPKDDKFITLLSRKPILKLTRKEIEEKVGGEWELIGE